MQWNYILRNKQLWSKFGSPVELLRTYTAITGIFGGPNPVLVLYLTYVCQYTTLYFRWRSIAAKNSYREFAQGQSLFNSRKEYKTWEK